MMLGIQALPKFFLNFENKFSKLKIKSSFFLKVQKRLI
jgi:hypothetical protein